MPVSKDKSSASQSDPSAEEKKQAEANPLVPKDKENPVAAKSETKPKGKTFRLHPPNDVPVEIEADCVEDAIRTFNGSGERRGKVLTCKQLNPIEL